MINIITLLLNVMHSFLLPNRNVGFFFFFVMQGKVPLISLNGLHQLHIFIFFLAIFHVFYGALTMTLGRLKVGIYIYLSIYIWNFPYRKIFVFLKICSSDILSHNFLFGSFTTKTQNRISLNRHISNGHKDRS